MSKDSSSLSKRAIKTYSVIFIVLLLVVVKIIASALNTAITERDIWIAFGKKHEKIDKIVYPNRGNIYSDEGRLLAISMPTYNTFIDFKAGGFNKDSFLLSKTNGIDTLARALSSTFKDKSARQYKAQLLKGLNSGTRRHVITSRPVTYDMLKKMKQFPLLNLNPNSGGFYYTERIVRERPFGTLAERTVGDVYAEITKEGFSNGKNGLELKYDSILKGIPGMSERRRIGGRWTDIVVTEPVNGMDIHTTINIDVQEFTQNALIEMLQKTDADVGTAVVMEVKTGKIKAITNLRRSVDQAGNRSYAETMNHAVADETEPGSTFKIAAMMVALEDGVCNPNDSVETGNGVYYYKGSRMTDHNANKGGYGRISAEDAIRYSSNIGISKIIAKGYEADPQKFIDGLNKIGIQRDLDIEIPGSGKPMIRQPKDTYWSKTSLAWMSFGYEVQMPPIYTLAFFNAIANGGTMLRPYFTDKITKDGKTVQTFEPVEVNSSVCSDETLEKIHNMLIRVVSDGTGKGAESETISIAGKTGTAQIAVDGSYTASGKRHQVSFCGYFPAEEPEYTAICVITRPRIGYPSGGTMAGGVVKKIAEQLYSNSLRLDLSKMSQDSLAIMLPGVKNGRVDKIKEVLKELDVDYDDQTTGDWAMIETDKENQEIILKDYAVQPKGDVVPSVRGMGAGDAIALLESHGLKVNTRGIGKVRRQSINAGSKVRRGATITLTLDNK